MLDFFSDFERRIVANATMSSLTGASKSPRKGNNAGGAAKIPISASACKLWYGLAAVRRHGLRIAALVAIGFRRKM
jgi:hypothetical protein